MSFNAGDKQNTSAADLECRRLEAQHDVWKRAFGGQLVFPTIDTTKSIRVLDSAGANGCWILDFMNALPSAVRGHPDSLFISADIDPLKFPKDEAGKTEITFLEHSFLKPWPSHLHGKFDLVHQRLVMAVSRSTPFVETVKNFATLLKPGQGWLQLVELDTSPDSVEAKKQDTMEDFKYLLETVATASGLSTYFARGLAQSLRDAGMMDVQEIRIEVPWGRAIVGDEALFQRSVAFPGIPYFAERSRAIAGKMGINDARFDDLPERIDKCLKETGGFVTAVVVWGRRAS